MKKVRARAVQTAVLATLLLLLFTPLVFSQSAQVLDAIDEVEQETQQIRGLEELYPIDVRFMTTKELEQMLLDELAEDYSAEDWERDEGLLKLLGFLEQDDDYYRIMLDLYTEQVAGFYDPEEKYLALISEDTDMRAMDKMNLSHEVTHALQDQYYHLDQPPFDDPESSNYDVDFAATCLVEGDATLTMYLYMGEFTEEEYAELLEDSMDIDSKMFDAAPQYIQDSLMFPYEQGADFVQRIYDKDEFESVDQAYADPPTSSEQIMHPDKYFKRDIPMQVECPDISSSLEEGWELADTNVMGEFDVQELLMTELNRSDADDGAEGWGGCQYRYYTNAGTEGRLMVIDIAWDTEDDAEEFAGMFEEYVDTRYDLSKGSYEMVDNWAVWDTGSEGAVGLSLEGNRTLAVFSTENNPLSDAAAALGNGGEELASILKNRPELEKKMVDDESSSANMLVLALVVGLLVFGMALVVVILVVNRREKAARAVNYPWPPQPQGQWQQPQWTQQQPQWTQQQWPPQPPQPPGPSNPPPDTSSDG